MSLPPLPQRLCCSKTWLLQAQAWRGGVPRHSLLSSAPSAIPPSCCSLSLEPRLTRPPTLACSGPVLPARAVVTQGVRPDSHSLQIKFPCPAAHSGPSASEVGHGGHHLVRLSKHQTQPVRVGPQATTGSLMEEPEEEKQRILHGN